MMDSCAIRDEHITPSATSMASDLWNPVDIMPEKEGAYIVTIDYALERSGNRDRAVTTDFWVNGIWREFDTLVIAYMSLPAPYQG